MSLLLQIEREVRHQKKYLDRFTKMILSDELRLFVERQKNAILVAFSNYAACSQISYNQQMPVWEELGKEICPTYEELVEQFKTEFDEMKKEEEESDVPEIDDDEEDEEEDKKEKVKEVTLSSESESVPEVSSSENSDSDSDDLDNVSDSSDSSL